MWCGQSFCTSVDYWIRRAAISATTDRGCRVGLPAISMRSHTAGSCHSLHASQAMDYPVDASHRLSRSSGSMDEAASVEPSSTQRCNSEPWNAKCDGNRARWCRRGRGISRDPHTECVGAPSPQQFFARYASRSTRNSASTFLNGSRGSKAIYSLSRRCHFISTYQRSFGLRPQFLWVLPSLLSRLSQSGRERCTLRR